MCSCHQSRLVIGHKVAITASFDEHECIDKHHVKNSNGIDSQWFPGPSLSKRRWNVSVIISQPLWCGRFTESTTTFYDTKGKQVRGPFVKMAVPCTDSYHSHFWRVGLGDVTTNVFHCDVLDTNKNEKTNVLSLTKWLLCVFNNSISQPALMSDKLRWQIVGRTRRGAAAVKSTTRSQQSGCVLWLSHTYHSQLCWLLWCVSVILKINTSQHQEYNVS